MRDTFMGYGRKDGNVGTRNFVGVLSTVVCANEAAIAVKNQVAGTAVFAHSEGCCQTPMDVHTVDRTLAALGGNPNLHSVLLLGLGCESTHVEDVARKIRERGKRAEILLIQECGGAARTIAEAVLLTQSMVKEASLLGREEFPLSEVRMGMKCGSSDTTSGLIPNPALGVASDLLVKAGGTSIFGEITEIIGAEHILAEHAANGEVAKQIYALVEAMENRAKAIGVDMRGGQPTEGNIKGGLTTIEEKSLGAVAKAGKAPIMEVRGYGEAPHGRGLVLMDSPGREPEILTGLAAAGCNVIVFATGRGAPQGFPFVPVIKITGSRTAVQKMSDHIDLDLSSIIDGAMTLEEGGEKILEMTAAVCSGQQTMAEINGYTNSMNIYVHGPVI